MTPLAESVGLDYSLAHFTPPRTDEQLAYQALYCGYTVLDAFLGPDAWPEEPFGMPKRKRRAAAKQMSKLLPTDCGRAGICLMTQTFGSGMADIWEDAAESRSGEEADALLNRAEVSRDLSHLVGSVFPAEDLYGSVQQVREAAQNRIFDPENVDAPVDLWTYSIRADATAEGLAVAVGDEFDSLAEAIIGPVIVMPLVASVVISTTWNQALKYWSNLLTEEPLCLSDVMAEVVAEG